MSHGELGAEPGYPPGHFPLCHMVSWVERQHRKGEKCKKEKKKSRLKTDKTNIYILYQEEDGRKQCPRFQLCSSPPPCGTTCLPMEGRSQHPWDEELHKSWPAHTLNLGHFIPALKPRVQGL